MTPLRIFTGKINSIDVQDCFIEIIIETLKSLKTIECTSSLIQILFKKHIFGGFIVNSTVLFLNLLEFFFPDKSIDFYKVRKAPFRKKYFSNKKKFSEFFFGFKTFSYRHIWVELPKIFFLIFMKFWHKYPKKHFWAMVILKVLFLWLWMSKIFRYRIKMTALTSAIN